MQSLVSSSFLMASAPCVVIADGCFFETQQSRCHIPSLPTLLTRPYRIKVVVEASHGADLWFVLQLRRCAAMLCCYAGKLAVLLPVHGIWHEARHAPGFPACKQPGISKHKHRPCGIWAVPHMVVALGV